MSIIRVLFVAGVLAAAATGSAAASPDRVYRCVGESGEPAFSQRPCSAAAAPVVTLPQRASPTGSGLRASEKAWLAQRRSGREAGGRAASGSRDAARRGRGSDSQKASEQAYRCRQKRRALDAVKATLRRGYKPAQGEKLRRRRRSHEDYLAAFCP